MLRSGHFSTDLGMKCHRSKYTAGLRSSLILLVLVLFLVLTQIIRDVPWRVPVTWTTHGVKVLDANANTSRGDVRVAVCISGAARTFSTALSLETIKAAFSYPNRADVDFFIWITNDPLRGDRNSKNRSYAVVSNGEVRRAAAYLARSTPFGSFVLNEANFHTSPTCDFGKYSKLRRDRSDEDVVTRSTQMLFKREKCFELVRTAEEELQIDRGRMWKYTTIVSIRPDIFFYGPVPSEAVMTNTPLLPAPAHGSAVKYANGHVPNNHIAFLPRNRADEYFYLARSFRTCTGVFQGPLGQEIEDELIKRAFALEVINTRTVVPYTLNRNVPKYRLCDRVAFYGSNIKEDDVSYWLKRCNEFVNWFSSSSMRTEQLKHVILHHWKSKDAI